MTRERCDPAEFGDLFDLTNQLTHLHTPSTMV